MELRIIGSCHPFTLEELNTGNDSGVAAVRLVSLELLADQLDYGLIDFRTRVPELPQNAISVEHAVRHKDRSQRMAGGAALAVVDTLVPEPGLSEPRQCPGVPGLLVAQLEADDTVVCVIPHDQVEEVIGEPAPSRFAFDLPDVSFLAQHRLRLGISTGTCLGPRHLERWRGSPAHGDVIQIIGPIDLQ